MYSSSDWSRARSFPQVTDKTTVRSTFVTLLLTYGTCERRIDAKASSDEAVVDVEVDRCVDKNSASNHDD